MSTQLATIKSGLETLVPQMAAIAPSGINAERISRSIAFAIEQNNTLAGCTMPSIISSAMSAAVLGLECDGPSGQGYIIPYFGRERRAQFVAGYKGYVSLAYRAGRTLEGFVVREGEELEFDEPAGHIEHRRVLGRESDRKVIGVYAVSRAQGQPTLVRVLSIDEVLAVRDASNGWRAFASGKVRSSTWQPESDGGAFSAMARKTAMRRLAKDLPQIPHLAMAAALDEGHDLGRHAYVEPGRGVVMEGELAPASAPPMEPDDTVEYVLRGPRGEKRYQSLAALRAGCISAAHRGVSAADFQALNADVLENITRVHGEVEASRLVDLFLAKE